MPSSSKLIHCTHCKAPVKSVFEGGPLKSKFEEKNFTLETGQYNIGHTYDEVKNIPGPDMTKQRTPPKEWLRSMSRVSRMSESGALPQSWSGYTFMTEHEERKIEKKYQERNVDAAVDRVVWRSFRKKLKKQQIVEKTTNAGPDWFQDLSPAQMALVDKMEELLQSDIKERHSGRTQQFLYDLGIWPEIPPKTVAKCVKNSGGNVISFFFLAHEAVAKIETPEYEEKFQDAKKAKTTISPYSINERILLTSVFHFHYPTLLKKLDRLLPEPYSPPNILWGKKPPKKKKKYSSPYLEPLPINDKPWYEERVEEELEKKILRRIKREKETKDRKELMKKMMQQEEKLELRQTELRESKRKMSQSGGTLERLGSVSLSLFEEEDIVNLAALPPRERKSFFFKKYSERLKSFVDQTEGELTPPLLPPQKLGKTSLTDSEPGLTDTRCSEADSIPSSNIYEEDLIADEEDEKLHGNEMREITDFKDEAKLKNLKLRFANADLLKGLFGSAANGVYLTKCLLDTELENISEDINLIKIPSLISPRSSSEETMVVTKDNNFTVPLDITYKELVSVSRTSSTIGIDPVNTRKMSGPPLPDVLAFQTLMSSSTTKVPTMKKPYVVECTEPECAMIEGLEEPMDEFEFAKRRISTMPPKKHLGAAIRFLCDKGDPLAVLPKMEMVPWLIRWYDKRRGIKRFLTKNDKDELLSKSQAIWNTDYTSPLQAPMVDIPEYSYSWSKKEWLMNLINQRVTNHQRAIKHILIDNARDLFPSMFCEYYETGLNKNFKNTFYAYFPARERDCLVVRPWNPNESNDEKQKMAELK